MSLIIGKARRLALASAEGASRRSTFDPSQAQTLTSNDAPTGVAYWGTSPETWHRVWLGGVLLPGTCVLEGAPGMRIDRRRVKGLHGGRATQLGYEPAEISIDLTLWQEVHLREFEALLPTLYPKPSRGQPSIVAIVHPTTDMFGIRYVQVVRATLPRQREPGVWEVRLTCLESTPESVRKKAKVQTGKITDIPTAIPVTSSSAAVSQAPSKTGAGPT